MFPRMPQSTIRTNKSLANIMQKQTHPKLIKTGSNNNNSNKSPPIPAVKKTVTQVLSSYEPGSKSADLNPELQELVSRLVKEKKATAEPVKSTVTTKAVAIATNPTSGYTIAKPISSVLSVVTSPRSTQPLQRVKTEYGSSDGCSSTQNGSPNIQDYVTIKKIPLTPDLRSPNAFNNKSNNNNNPLDLRANQSPLITVVNHNSPQQKRSLTLINTPFTQERPMFHAQQQRSPTFMPETRNDNSPIAYEIIKREVSPFARDRSPIAHQSGPYARHGSPIARQNSPVAQDLSPISPKKETISRPSAISPRASSVTSSNSSFSNNHNGTYMNEFLKYVNSSQEEERSSKSKKSIDKNPPLTTVKIEESNNKGGAVDSGSKSQKKPRKNTPKNIRDLKNSSSDGRYNNVIDTSNNIAPISSSSLNKSSRDSSLLLSPSQNDVVTIKQEFADDAQEDDNGLCNNSNSVNNGSDNLITSFMNGNSSQQNDPPTNYYQQMNVEVQASCANANSLAIGSSSALLQQTNKLLLQTTPLYQELTTIAQNQMPYWPTVQYHTINRSWNEDLSRDRFFPMTAQPIVLKQEIKTEIDESDNENGSFPISDYLQYSNNNNDNNKNDDGDVSDNTSYPNTYENNKSNNNVMINYPINENKNVMCSVNEVSDSDNKSVKSFGSDKSETGIRGQTRRDLTLAQNLSNIYKSLTQKLEDDLKEFETCFGVKSCYKSSESDGKDLVQEQKHFLVNLYEDIMKNRKMNGNRIKSFENEDIDTEKMNYNYRKGSSEGCCCKRRMSFHTDCSNGSDDKTARVKLVDCIKYKRCFRRNFPNIKFRADSVRRRAKLKSKLNVNDCVETDCETAECRANYDHDFGEEPPPKPAEVLLFETLRINY